MSKAIILSLVLLKALLPDLDLDVKLLSKQEAVKVQMVYIIE